MVGLLVECALEKAVVGVLGVDFAKSSGVVRFVLRRWAWEAGGGGGLIGPQLGT